MPTNLRNLLASKQDSFAASPEENIESGRIWLYYPGSGYDKFPGGFCFKPCVAGTATVEVWGAGGSGAHMCCCGYGLPGNPGAYSKRKISLTACGYITGNTGYSCGNADALCDRGCGESSGITWYEQGTTCCGCICAQGGKGGISYCSTGASGYCCFAGNGFCATKTNNDNCGIICNYCPGMWQATAYGGSTNCPGGFSRVSFFGCQLCPCFTTQHVRGPSGQISQQGVEVSFVGIDGSGASNWSGQGRHEMLAALSATTRWPQMGHMFSTCWGFSGGCGCYQNDGCKHYYPAGWPGLAPYPCPGVRDHATRGGHGAVRIKFVRS